MDCARINMHARSRNAGCEMLTKKSYAGLYERSLHACALPSGVWRRDLVQVKQVSNLLRGVRHGMGGVVEIFYRV